MSLPVRRPGRRAAARGPARASAAGTAAARALGLAGALVSAGLLAWLVVGHAFAAGATDLRVEGAHYTSLEAIETALGIRDAQRLDLVTLRTAPLVARLEQLPAVDAALPDAAQVRVVLPDRLVVALRERRPILAWQIGSRRLLADTGGLLFAEEDSAVDPSLPLVTDERSAASTLAVGQQVEPLVFAAVRRLAAVTPALLRSTAPSLMLDLTDADGLVLAAPGAWRAVFGLYTENLRPPSTVDRQVQCLTSLLGKVGEGTVATVYLSPAGDACGTYTTRATRP